MSSSRPLYLGPRLRRLRRELGLTQAVMADDLAISPSYIALLERNQRPLTADLLLRLARAYTGRESYLLVEGGDLRTAGDAVRLSRATLRTIKQNLGWAFGYNIAAIPLAAAGLLTPMIAGFAMAMRTIPHMVRYARQIADAAPRAALDAPFVTADGGAFARGDARALPRSPFSAFRLGLLTQLSNPKPAVMFSAIFLGTVPPHTPIWVYIALLCVVMLNETIWNILVARIFSTSTTRARYISLKCTIDRSFGGLLALLGLKVAVS